jgi:hypothetical protein
LRARISTYSAGTITVTGTTSIQGGGGGGGGGGSVTQGTSPWVDNITQFGGVNISTGTGASGTGIPRVTVSNDSRIIIIDPTATPITVKPASTAPVATDTSLVTALNPNSPGIITLGQAVKANSVPVTFASDQDVCSYAAKSSTPITLTTIVTATVVPVSGSTAVYVCGFSFTIAPSATSADTIKFVYGTGAACASGQTALTGTYGNGDLTIAAPVVPISYGNGNGTVMIAPASNGLCTITTGTAVNIQGILSYVQQ